MGIGAGIVSGACGGGTNPPPGPKPSPRAVEPGDKRPLDGLVENSEFPWAEATIG
jgi:hypothetical protein